MSLVGPYAIKRLLIQCFLLKSGSGWLQDRKKGVQIALHAFFEDRFRVEGRLWRDGECFPAGRFPKTCASFRIARR